MISGFRVSAEYRVTNDASPQRPSLVVSGRPARPSASSLPWLALLLGLSATPLAGATPSPGPEADPPAVSATLAATESPAGTGEQEPSVHIPSMAATSPVTVSAGTIQAPAQDAHDLGDRAVGVASATLAALLPRLVANDTLPLLDRSVLLAGDLSRLLQHYQGGMDAALGADEAGDSPAGKIRTLLERATALLGTPYRWGGNSPDSGFDCSGLVSYVFRTALGIELPRISRDMARQPDAELIRNREDLQQGDLVFFGRRGRVDHVGIYVGEGQFVHAPSRGKDVRMDSITGGYWGAKFMQARRVEM